MTLSIVIVNYNVKYFLKQCLQSVFASDLTLADGQRLELEVWVVDNDSADGSVGMVERDFPQVHLIANHDNRGFACANNQALRQATGDWLLLLNPDTIVERGCLARCADLMRSRPDVGGLTVKMVDGKGNYLKESKRGFPSPEASFYKISGLIHLFPHSRRVAAYYMGHLPDDEPNEIEIMPGAFLMVSRAAYDKVGGLDESYFMYGEDIDFSWRIRLAGYNNYYLPTTRILHYKGESTRKSSMNYVYTFYNAMSIFVGKYFTGRGGRLFNALLKCAIWMRAALAWAGRIASRVAVPLADFGLSFGGFVAIKHLWASYYGHSADYYPPQYTLVVIPLYILILMCASWLGGGYDRPVKAGRIVRGMGAGLLALLAFYSLLDESQRYSRMLLLMGAAWTLAATLLVRVALSLLHVKGYALRPRKRDHRLVVGSEAEAERVRQLYADFGVRADHIECTSETQPRHLQDLIRIGHVEEVCFCGSDMPLDTIIRLMAQLRTTGVEYKIAPAEGDFIVGAGNVLSQEDLYIADLDTVGTDANRRRKRLFDIGSATLLLLAAPVTLWLAQRKGRYLRHCLGVLWGRYSWVGHAGRKGVFQPADLAPDASDALKERITLQYMRHYKVGTDFAILTRNWKRI